MAKTNFKDIQYAFTRHLRDPENNPAPEGIEDRR
ncbi:MAG: DNA-binding domain-containing protein, partial [Gammaproteobacteria bacterium]|nr:DNA-binding domain-containing protein [Gammaproteobacteria bacterium]